MGARVRAHVQRGEVRAPADDPPRRHIRRSHLADDAGVPFEDDGLRDGEHLRSGMTGRFRAELTCHGLPHVVLTGAPRTAD